VDGVGTGDLKESTQPGSPRIDHYQLERELGRGGMAVVFLAHDQKHGRRVAVKILHAELAAMLGPERFVQEIRVLAALQHPHILGLIDSGVLADHAGELRGRPYYVMPYVEGETLRRRLEREGPLPVPEAVRIATEVAGALAYAHRHGVIHRDIKPENILLHDGSALVADFGIALAVEQAGGARMTQTGMSLGTPQYMAPEQAMGEKTVDARADVYALGCVLYEMLTGEPPFTGPSAQAIVARVMTEQPVAPAARRATIPAHVEDAVLTAIEKLPADRFASAADFGTALADPLARPRRTHRAPATARAVKRWPVAILAGTTLAMTVVAAWALLRPTASHIVAGGPVYETSIALADSTPLAYVGSSPLGVGTPALAVSPDGMTLVFVGQSGATTRLYQRRLDASAVAVLPGTDGAYGPFFSPDGQSVGFFSGGTVKRTNLQTGATVSLAELVLPYGGVWLAEGRILIAAQEGDQLVAVPSTGGAPAVIGSPEVTRRAVFPSPLPGDSTVLMSTIDSHLAVASTGSGRMELLGPDGPVRVDSVKQTSRLFVGTNPRYVTSGHLLYHSLDATVMAVPFDPRTRRALGPAVPVLSGVRLESIWGVGQLAVTRDGTLIYARGANGRLNTLVWRDDRGRVDTLKAFGRADYGDLDLSADGTGLVTHICTSQGSCAPRALRLGEGIQVTLPADQAPHIGSGAVGWADRGQTVFDRRGTRPDGTTDGTVIYAPEDPTRAQVVPKAGVLDVARDGRVLFERGDSLFVAPNVAALTSEQTATGFRLPEPDAWGHQLRQGGDWVAYTARSEQAGEYVVFVARTHPPYEHWRASPRGGEEPVWSPDGALVYREGNRWMRVSVPNVPGGSPGAAQFLFAGAYLNVLGRSHDIAPDGRHLLIAGPSELTTTSLTVVTNWVTRLPAQAPPR